MKRYSQYFTFEAILDVLASIRMRQAAKRHERQFYWEILVDAEFPLAGEPIVAECYLPPRRLWRRPAKANRRRQPSSAVWRAALIRTVLGYRRQGKLADEAWGRNLLALVDSIQRKIAGPAFALQIPKVRVFHKDGDWLKLRVITEYQHLEDRLILTQTAKYLKDELDDVLLDVSYAFRRSRPACNPTHHQAVRDLQAYRTERVGQKLFAAECDIQGFYDAIGHAAVRDALGKIECQRADAGCEPLDAAALHVVDAYLDSFCFADGGKVNPDIVAAYREENGTVPDVPINGLRKTNMRRVGIPQGGALSPVLANVVLHAADMAVVQDGERDPELFYARFCDDTLLVHSSRQKCSEALRRYKGALKRLDLPVHSVNKGIRYGVDYYKAKSKGPFQWAHAGASRRGMPWISFVGYQVHCDGEIRLRKTTVHKHFKRQVREVSAITGYLKEAKADALKKKPQEVFNSARARMISLGVGRPDVRRRCADQSQHCWMDAFPLLEETPFVLRQLRALDRNRERQLHRLKRQLEKHAKTQGEMIRIYKHPLGVLLAKLGKDKQRRLFLSDESVSYVGRLKKRAPFELRIKNAPPSIRGYNL